MDEVCECQIDCRNYNVDQGYFPCNECNRLIVLKDHYKKEVTKIR